MADWFQSSCLFIQFCILPDHRGIPPKTCFGAGRGPTQIFRQQEFVQGPGGPAWSSSSGPLATLSGCEPGPGTSHPAGEPWPSSPGGVPLQLCEAMCSLLERAMLTLFSVGRGLWQWEGVGGSSLQALGGSLCLFPKGMGRTLSSVAPFNLFGKGHLWNLTPIHENK